MPKLASLLALVLPAAALAQPAPERVPAPALPCGQVAAIVTQRGAALVSTGPYTYERLVRDMGFCTIEQTTEPFYGPSAEAGQCFLGYRCKDRATEGRRGD
ncbi:hypothetical protein [Methylobacterium nodulans]|uniref:Uncharacterized protein n=1 Tax=Methylobacterium nodulans (strain LMG 21967 / CNCM I-2342 / ORS 2060) TaxID=460265 RepID=B8ITY9_METNO|nr:hypothetical protein [Methylobacterium nodulans]ACL60847.1 conserved hypothetical protein [Methylobacterium nodulans ORS 2060]